MSNILIVSSPSVYGGGEVYLKNLINNEFFIKKFNVTLLCASDLLIQEVKGNCDIIKIPASTTLSINALKSILIVNKVIKAKKINCLFLNGLSEFGVYANFLNSNNIVCVGHSNEFWLMKPAYINIKHLLKRLFCFGFEKKISKFIAINNLSKENFKYFSPHSSVKVIYNGVPKLDINRKKLGDNFSFGRISRLTAGKGNENLLYAFAELLSKYKNINLILSGTGECLDDLKELASKLQISDNVDFTGHVRAYDFFSQIDCMISPSDMEATPLVILESMSADIPIIATSVGGVPELVRHSIEAILIQPNDIGAIQKAMLDFIENPSSYATLAKNAKKKFESEFTIDRMVKSTIKYINKEC